MPVDTVMDPVFLRLAMGNSPLAGLDGSLAPLLTGRNSVFGSSSSAAQSPFTGGPSALELAQLLQAQKRKEDAENLAMTQALTEEAKKILAQQPEHAAQAVAEKEKMHAGRGPRRREQACCQGVPGDGGQAREQAPEEGGLQQVRDGREAGHPCRVCEALPGEGQEHVAMLLEGIDAQGDAQGVEAAGLHAAQAEVPTLELDPDRGGAGRRAGNLQSFPPPQHKPDKKRAAEQLEVMAVPARILQRAAPRSTCREAPARMWPR